MAKKQKKEEQAPGSPAWMATFSDLISILMCFFVLMFAMSNVDQVKLIRIAQSFNPNVQISNTIFTGAGGDIISEMAGNGIIEFPVPPSSALPGDDFGGEGSEQTDIDDADILNAAEQIRLSQSADELTPIADDLRTYFAEHAAAMSGTSGDSSMAEPEEGADEGDIGVEVTQADFYINLEFNESVTFDTASHTMKPEGLEILKIVAEVLKGYPNNDIVIEGHTDSIPIFKPPLYPDNYALSAWRAREVLLFFIDEGIEPIRMIATGFGESRPIATNDTPEGRALNRRVEIKIYSSFYSGVNE